MGSLGSPLPTNAQLTLMNTSWTATSVTNDGQPGTIGMYGTDDKYYFWMDFTASDSDLWHASGASPKDFILLFQMGDTQSDWTGVTLNLTTDVSGTTYETLDKLSAANAIKTGGFSNIETDGRDNSTFEGYLTLTADSTSCTIRRLIERSE